MNYNQALEYLYNQLPMFQRIGNPAYKANIDDTIAIDNIIGNPHNNYKSIHIAGTNGKGSVAHLTASILQTKGLKVGLYTSPHLKDFRERIRINGKKIRKKYVCSFIEKYSNDFKIIKPSFFEITFAMAAKYFSDEKIDIAVMETGMGGRLDSTNIINPILSVITNISYDHTKFLGNTLKKIAAEKAGIIKPNTDVVIGETQNMLKSVFIQKAKKENSAIYFADESFKAKNVNYTIQKNQKLTMDIYKNNKIYLNKLDCALLGLYEQKNIITVLGMIERLNSIGYKISKNHIRKGIKDVVKQTKLTGRWQIISKKPLTICDTGHNEDGIKEVVKQIKITPHKKLHFVFGMVNDKDIDTILSLLPRDAVYYFCKANIPRGLNQKILANKANKSGLKGKAYSSVKEALSMAQKKANVNDLVFIGGSNFIVAEII